MAQIRATKDPGIAVDFSHSDVEQIKDAAEPVPVIQEKVVKAAVIVPAAGPTMTEAASSIAEAIALRKEELVRTDGGHGVEVVFDVQALTLGDWDIIAVRPLPSTVPSVSMVETFSLVSSSPPTAAEAGEVLFVFAVAEDRRIVFNEGGRRRLQRPAGAQRQIRVSRLRASPADRGSRRRGWPRLAHLPSPLAYDLRRLAHQRAQPLAGARARAHRAASPTIRSGDASTVLPSQSVAGSWSAGMRLVVPYTASRWGRIAPRSMRPWM
jgi:hypothetical protein